MFTVDYLEIKSNEKANTDLYKNLKPGIYPFHSLEKKVDLWENHVNIQAIVGKNGAGKSSLMDLLYVAINNFAYMFERGHHRAAAESLCYVKGLYVDVGYTIGDDIYTLCCDGDSIQLLKKEAINPIVKFDINEHNALEDEIEDGEIRKIVNKFFYTIVTNYSLHSFISSNYICDTYVYNGGEHKDGKPEDVDNMGQPWKKNYKQISDSKEKIWLNSVFHKNDGYIRSLVLNPYRNNGVIDMEKEKELAKYRLVALLIDCEKSKTNIFRDYTLDRIVFSLDENKILRKFQKHTIESLIKKVRNQLKRKKVEVLEIIDAFKLKINKSSPDFQLIAFAYLQIKIDKIVRNYESYKKYRSDGKKTIYDTDISSRRKNLKALCRQISKDSSHVVTKIKQTINFLSYSEENSYYLKESIASFKWMYKTTFTYRGDYCPIFVHSYSTIDDIINRFPPPIFKYDVYLNRLASRNESFYKSDPNYFGRKTFDEMKNLSDVHEGAYFITKKADKRKTKREKAEYVNANIIVKWKGNHWEKDEIKLSELSSGELQMMHTLSTHAYHIRNLMSVDEKMIKYHNINMVFDEVEICFHPEYQRQFISRLLAMLKALCRFKQEMDYNFNVVILTHSPFILSDLPSSNVLYLEEGKVVEIKSETFAQNISDLLNQNFFLDYFVGEYSKNQINFLIDCLLDAKNLNEKEKNKINKFINVIGDEFLRKSLEKKYKEVYGEK